jgi:zinc transport system permease protein
MMSEFLILPLITALLAALLAGVLGPVVVWRRMAYLGDTIAHGALLGVAFALIANLSIVFGIVASSLAIAVLFARMENRASIQADATLGILSHGSLAIALVAFSLSGKTVDINALLFGDVLAANSADAAMLAAVLAAVMLGMFTQWNHVMRVLIHEDMATVDGLAVARLRLMLTLALALTVALSIKVTGVLLITALLILPAVSARALARTPQQMMALSCLLAAASVALGFAASLQVDTPLSPTIIVAGLAVLVFIHTLKKVSP